VDRFLDASAKAGTPFLWITDRRAPKAAENGQVLRVTTIPGRVGTLDPKRVQELRTAAAAFLDEHGSSVVVVDCVDLLVLHNGVERVVRALTDLHEETATREAVLAVFVSPRSGSPRLIAWLERELEPMPSPDPDLERWMPA